MQKIELLNQAQVKELIFLLGGKEAFMEKGS